MAEQEKNRREDTEGTNRTEGKSGEQEGGKYHQPLQKQQKERDPPLNE